jgi:predicted TPR repeat methyltransferase
METPQDYIYADRIPLNERIETLSFVFKDILSPNGFLPPEAIKGNVLDLGCGRGAVGEILKSKNPEINLTGVDIYDYPERNPQVYSQFFRNYAVDFLKQIQEKGPKFDLIISVGMPPEEIEKIMEEIDPDKVLKPGGYIALITDSPLKPKKEGKFQIRKGNYPADNNIAYYSHC